MEIGDWLIFAVGRIGKIYCGYLNRELRKVIMTAAFQDVYGVLKLVATQFQDKDSLEEEENCYLLNLPKITNGNQAFIAVNLGKDFMIPFLRRAFSHRLSG